VGHLFQSRYKSIVVEREGYCLSLSRYLHLNPVRGKVIGRGDPLERRKRLRTWRWSSYRGYSGLAKPEPWMSQERVLGEMSGSRKGRRLRYRRSVEEGLVREIENPLEAVKWQAALGREGFLRKLRDRLVGGKEQHREVPSLRKLQPKLEAGAILESVAQAYQCAKRDVLKQGKRGNEARAVAMVLIWDCCGMRLREIGELFGGSGYTAVAQTIARTREKNRRNALRFKLGKLMDICVK
jgi:putative transposase